MGVGVGVGESVGAEAAREIALMRMGGMVGGSAGSRAGGWGSSGDGVGGAEGWGGWGEAAASAAAAVAGGAVDEEAEWWGDEGGRFRALLAEEENEVGLFNPQGGKVAGVSDKFLTGLIFFLCYLAVALILNFVACGVFQPPPRRFPKKRPVCGFLPWALVGRLLGWGFLTWHGGEPLSFRQFFYERHELLSVWWGDPGIISLKLRQMMLLGDIVATLALSCAFTDPSGEQYSLLEGDLAVLGVILIYVFIFTGNIVMGVAFRLTVVACSHHKIILKGIVYLLTINGAFLTLAIFVMEYKRRALGAELGPVMELYLARFFSSLAIGYLVIQPLQCVIVYKIGMILYKNSADNWTFNQMMFSTLTKDKLRKKLAAVREKIRLRKEAEVGGGAAAES